MCIHIPVYTLQKINNPLTSRCSSIRKWVVEDSTCQYFRRRSRRQPSHGTMWRQCIWSTAADLSGAWFQPLASGAYVCYRGRLVCVWTYYDDDDNERMHSFLPHLLQPPTPPTHDAATCRWRTSVPRLLPSRGFAQWWHSAGRLVPAHAAGDQLAFHHSRPDARIVLRARSERMCCTRSVLFDTCCALSLTRPSPASALLSLKGPTCWEAFVPLTELSWRKLSRLWQCLYFFRKSQRFES